MDDNAVNEAVGIDAESVGTEQTDEVVYAGDLLNEDHTDTSEDAQQSEKVQPQQKAPAKTRTFTQDDMNAAISRRLADERKKPAYQLANELLSEEMRSGKDISEAEALQRIRQRRIKERVSAYKGDTTKFMEDVLLERENEKQTAKEPDAEGADTAKSLTNKLIAERNSGVIPQDFDLIGTLKDPDRQRQFLSDREKYGAAAAVALAQRSAEQPQQEDRREQARKLPKPFSATNNGYRANAPDYENMSAENFRKAEAEIRRSAASGKKVRL